MRTSIDQREENGGVDGINIETKTQVKVIENFEMLSKPELINN